MAEMDNDTLDWRGADGRKYSELYPSSAESADKECLAWHGKTLTEILQEVFKAAHKDSGLEVSKAKLLNIGCTSGANLHVAEKLGVRPCNLYGVDLSARAVEIARREHPEYQIKAIDGYGYYIPSIDIVFHVGLLSQIVPMDYDKFFDQIGLLRPKYYLIFEGINPAGYEKIPNGEAHKPAIFDEDHPKHQVASANPSLAGFHHTNDMARVVEQHLPEAKLLHSQRFDEPPSPGAKKWARAIKTEYCLANLYRLQ